SAELKIFASRAIWTVLTEIGPEFEKNSGHKLDVITGLSSEFVRRINAGEMFDVIAAPPAALDGLIGSGKVAADSKTNLAPSAYGVVVRAGAPKPDVSSVEAFKRAAERKVDHLSSRAGCTATHRAAWTQGVYCVESHDPEHRHLFRAGGQGRNRIGHHRH